MVNTKAKPYLLERNVQEDKIVISEHYKIEEIEQIKNRDPALVVMDTYKASNDYINNLYRCGIKLALFIDTLEYKDIEVDFLINGNIYADGVEYKEELQRNNIHYKQGIFGTENLILNSSIKKIMNPSAYEKQITLTTGGADPSDFMDFLMKKVTIKNHIRNIIVGPFFTEKQIKNIEAIKRKDDKIYHAPKTLNSIIAASDIVISSAGSTVYEILFHKKTFALFQTGDDQRMIVDYFRKKRIAIFEPEFDDNSVDCIIDRLTQQSYINQCKMYGDKITTKGSNRVAEILMKGI